MLFSDVSVLFSDARDHRIFARMGAITVAAALFGDMVFLPAILARFDKKRSSKMSDQINTDDDVPSEEA